MARRYAAPYGAFQAEANFEAELQRKAAERAAKTARQLEADRQWAAQQFAERDRLRKEQAERERRQRDADIEADLKRRFMAAGGSEAAWNREKAAIIAEHRKRVSLGDLPTPTDRPQALVRRYLAEGGKRRL